jgi:threonyl-tRNA synthetase
LDFNFPERFNIEYVDTDGEKKKAVMIHRTVLGSMERFFGNLIEHYKGAFPGWLAPTQVKILTITDDQTEYAKTLQSKLLQADFRVDLDLRNEKIGFKIRESEKEKIPFMFVLGNKEMDDGTVSVRERGRKDLGTMSIEDALSLLSKETAVPQLEN